MAQHFHSCAVLLATIITSFLGCFLFVGPNIILVIGAIILLTPDLYSQFFKPINVDHVQFQTDFGFRTIWRCPCNCHLCCCNVASNIVKLDLVIM